MIDNVGDGSPLVEAALVGGHFGEVGLDDAELAEVASAVAFLLDTAVVMGEVGGLQLADGLGELVQFWMMLLGFGGRGVEGVIEFVPFGAAHQLRQVAGVVEGAVSVSGDGFKHGRGLIILLIYYHLLHA